jgi:hypothetical protein
MTANTVMLGARKIRRSRRCWRLVVAAGERRDTARPARDRRPRGGPREGIGERIDGARRATERS